LFDWMSAFNAKVYLVHTGVDTERFRPPSVERLQAGWLEAPVLTWSGGVFDDTTLDAARGVLAFFGELHSITPHVRLLLLAYGNYLPRLAKVIREQSAADCIELVTNTHPHEMPRWLSQAHAGIFYFPEITPWVRSKSPTKLFEYMACGVVPVCGRGSEADWVVTDGQDGILFDQVREGAERLAQVLESREHWTAMADRARQKAVNEFSLISQTNRLIDMFRELDRKEQ
ncbi:MAG TPA: glycosyltransferase, partial [Acidobacteriota bacterium]|nr:glycosyltransferase [Acidobacteriota bacterium]